MTPKEKAYELLEKYNKDEILYDALNYNQAKKCAIIAVDEIINALPPFQYGLEFVAKIQFWLDVKYEIIEL